MAIIARKKKVWSDAAVRWLKEQSHKATAKEDVTKLRWLHSFLGGKDLTFINRALIDRITDAKLAQGCMDSSRLSEGAQGNPGPAQRGGGGADAETSREASDARVWLPG